MKNTSPSILLLFLALTLALVACEPDPSKPVDQEKIYAEYELFYDANEDQTYARATFKLSNAPGDKLRLGDGAEVSFNGDIMQLREDLAFYEQEYAGLVDSGGFTFLDLDGNTYQNSISIAPIAYPNGLDTISRDAAFTLNWLGGALNAGDDVTVTINGALNGDAQVFYTNVQGSDSIVLDRKTLQKLGRGNSTVWMDHRNYPGLRQGSPAGGYIVGRYRPVNATPYLD